jgi:Fibronectin type III domain
MKTIALTSLFLSFCAPHSYADTFFNWVSALNRELASVPNQATLRTWLAANPPVADPPIIIGNTQVFPTDGGGHGGYQFSLPVNLSQKATLHSLGLYCYVPDGTVYLGLYNDNGGAPGTLLASTPASPLVAGWNTVLVSTPTVLAPGTYWLSFIPSSSTMEAGATVLAPGSEYHRYQTTLRNPYPGPISRTKEQYSIFAILSPDPRGGGSGGISDPIPNVVKLAWDVDADPSVAGYFVLFGTAAGGENRWINAGNHTSSTVSGLMSGVTYFFVVEAYNSAGVSPPSNEVSAVAP